MERTDLARCLGAEVRGGRPRAVMIAASDPAEFMDRFKAAVAAGGTVFVADPRWGESERAQFATLLSSKPQTPNPKAKGDAGWLCLPTGGSSGVMRLARHDQDTLAAAALGCSRHFAAGRINAVGVLPLHHVSGLMAWLRCALTGGRYLPWRWEDLAAGRWPDTGPGDWFVSVVPTQLQRLLRQPAAAERLRRFRAVFLGGGPAWPDLLERAAAARLPLAPGYGMTETAAMIAALRPEEFLAGRRGCGTALPHGRITLGADGVVELSGGSLFRGYFPQWREGDAWQTEDLGRLDEHGGLHWLGRRDAAIITGGEKVDPGEVEAALRAAGAWGDVAVVGLPDAEWGEMVVACYPAGEATPDLAVVAEQVAARVAAHKRPKRYLALASWPRNAQGKVNRRELQALAQQAAGGVNSRAP